MAGGTTPTANPNKRLYNGGNEWQDDIDGLANYYSTFFREYDAVIGRFNGVDPESTADVSISIYVYSSNNPVNFNDPLGNLKNEATTDKGKFFESLLFDIENHRTAAGLGNYTVTYSGEDESGNGGAPYAESLNLDNPVSIAVLDLHIKWDVAQASLGLGGFNNVVKNVIAGGGASMNFALENFYNLTAEETVRQQILNTNNPNNFSDAFNTIVNAYSSILNFNTTLMQVQYTQTFLPRTDHITKAVDNKVNTDYNSTAFTNFANNPGSNYYTFGNLIRSIYHEFLHGWDLLGIKGNQRLTLSGNYDELEFRAEFRSMSQYVKLPQAPDLAIYYLWKKQIVENGRGEAVIRDSRITNPDKPNYPGWYLYMKNFVDNHKHK